MFTVKLTAALLVAMLGAGCATPSAEVASETREDADRILVLSRNILALGEQVDATEARRAAIIAVEYPRQLAREYDVEHSPIVHNLLVNLGIKERGLCIHWTHDLLVRLEQEKFHSLDLHWAIANYETAFRLEHSTVVISAREADLDQGLVLDPWRHSGRLHWAPLRDDGDYDWRPRADVHALKRAHQALADNRQALR